MFKSRLIIYLIEFVCLCSIVSSQQITNYIKYRSSFDLVTNCLNTHYFDIALLECSPCPSNSIQKTGDLYQCECANDTLYYGVNQGGGSLICLPCRSGYVRSSDGFGCIENSTTCNLASGFSTLTESNLAGTPHFSTTPDSQPREGRTDCSNCVNGTRAEQKDQRCSPCASITPRIENPQGSTIQCCSPSEIQSGLCLNYVRQNSTNVPTANVLNRFSTAEISLFFQENLQSSIYLCRMNLNMVGSQSSGRTLLSNVTACHILANIAAMQFYYPEENYAFRLYEVYIWQLSFQLWNSTTPRAAIPFLAYPSSYYSEISSSSYNWIPARFPSKNLIQIKLAKYSTTGEYLGLFDAFDSTIHLCGRGYTDGRPAFTFGTVFNRTCYIRIDALWSSDLYETAFFEPYLVVQGSATEQLIPMPVVIRNYQQGNTQPNRNDNPSSWVYHRRFFLVDRVSGVSTTNELRNVHYARSIKISYQLVNGISHIQPPVIIIDYGELTLSDIGKNGIVRIDFETSYQMDLTSHIRDIWIAIGVLCGAGLILGLVQTIFWHIRSGKQVIDLVVIGKFLLNMCNIVATSFFIVMAGVSMWWLVFFKRDDSIFFVIPTAAQQISFTVLVIVAFVLKSFDILQMIFRQSAADIFFVDWEKSTTADRNNVSIWRSYFVANELNELQTYRRISVTFQLIFVLFFLKVINLENVATAQPSTTIFPTSADYQAQYNGILRVGIAFSMWLAGGLIQYLIYTIFYQHFVENAMINLVDLCSLSNTSIFILIENCYGYYIHGRSPNDSADVNMADMMMNLQRESDQMIGRRGLEANSDDQSFTIKVSREFRSTYNSLLKNYQNRIENRASKKDDEHESDILMASYQNINEFFCNFLSRSLPTHNYVVRRRYLLEKIFNQEFRRTETLDNSDSIFYIDPDRNFSRLFFFGHENSLFVWNMATFLFVDYFAFNYVLAAIITYLFNSVMTKFRLNLGRNNLSKKTLIPKCFLI